MVDVYMFREDTLSLGVSTKMGKSHTALYEPWIL